MSGWAIAAYIVFAAASIVLTIIDVRAHRLPDAIVLPLYPMSLVLLAADGLVRADSNAFVRAVVCGLILFVAFLLLRVVQPSGMGGGDVKLAGVVGILLGYAGWGALIVGSLAAFLAGGVWALVLLAAGKATRSTRIAFGPFLLAGAWIALAVTLATS